MSAHVFAIGGQHEATHTAEAHTAEAHTAEAHTAGTQCTSLLPLLAPVRAARREPNAGLASRSNEPEPQPEPQPEPEPQPQPQLAFNNLLYLF